MKTNEFEKYANSFQAVTVPGLERIGALMRLVGNPERDLRFFHIAGTNGKGSVSANLACILEEAGFKVGKYISPNLISVNERISISGINISDDDLSRILGALEPLCKIAEAECGSAPTQFEIWTAAAFIYFKEMACDFVVLEVGLGGEFDATNVIDKCECSIITRLGIDHSAYLGNTIESIASAKAGIMKKNTRLGRVFTVNQEDAALRVLYERAKSLNLLLDIAEPSPLGFLGVYECFELAGGVFRCGLPGYHQIENASLAIMAARAMGIEDDIIERGVARAKNPARFEIIRENPYVIYDGGHNENGIAALTASLERYFGNVKKTVIFAAMKDKDIENSLKMLSTAGTEFIFTTVRDNPRAASAEELSSKARALGFEGEGYEDIREAYDKAIERGCLVLICGSLYLYKDFKELVKA